MFGLTDVHLRFVIRHCIFQQIEKLTTSLRDTLQFFGARGSCFGQVDVLACANISRLPFDIHEAVFWLVAAFLPPKQDSKIISLVC